MEFQMTIDNTMLSGSLGQQTEPSMPKLPAAAVVVINNEFRSRHLFEVNETYLREIMEGDRDFVERMIEDYDTTVAEEVGANHGLDTYERDWMRDLFATYLGFDGWPNIGADKETDKRFTEALFAADRDKIISFENRSLYEDDLGNGADTGTLINFVERLTESELNRLSALLGARMSELGLRPEMNLPRPKSVYLTGFDKDKYREVLDCVRFYVPRMGILAARKHLDDVQAGERRMLSMTVRTWEADDFKAALEAVGATVEVEWY